MKSQLPALYEKYLMCSGVSIDSRQTRPNDLFFGLKGGHFNGGKFAREALEAGAKWAVVDDKSYYTHPERMIYVPDALRMLQELAGYHRSRIRGKVFALTGSNGKTTTKELIHRVLQGTCKVTATVGNLNNEIGVPLTLLRTSVDVDVAIVEMGANRVGDISCLCEMVRPDYGLITNIGRAHTETFGGLEGVLRGKTELFDFVQKHNGYVFLNQLDERLSHMTRRFKHLCIYPQSGLSLIDSHPFLQLKWNELTIHTHLTGSYNFQNLSAAIAVGDHLGVTPVEIKNALEQYFPDNHRSQIIEKGSNRLIMDMYNANPDSMNAALENLAGFPGKKVAILGDMNELNDPEAAHRELGKKLTMMDLDKVIWVGEKIQIAGNLVSGAEVYSNVEEAKVGVNWQEMERSTILLKASRGIELEKLL